MPRLAIIGGTGFYKLAGGVYHERDIDTPFGVARLYVGEGAWSEFVFLARHGVDHSIPPHKVNYRANMKALSQLGVQKAMAVFTVGSLQPELPPKSLVLLDQFIDFTQGRESTYFDGGDSGLAHAEMNKPYCTALRQKALSVSKEINLSLFEKGTYVCTNGPRFETPAEIKMFAGLGGDVVGMTGVPEVVLARELGMHYAAVAISVNWAAGIQENIEIVSEGMEQVRQSVIQLFQEVLDSNKEDVSCGCEHGLMMMHPPTK